MDSISFFWSFVKMLTTLAIVIAILIGAMVLMKRFFYYPAPASGGRDAAIRVLSSHHLGPKSSLLLIDALGQVVLIGISDRQMSMLTTITDPSALDKLRTLRMDEGYASTSDPLSRCKSILKNIGRTRKER